MEDDEGEEVCAAEQVRERVEENEKNENDLIRKREGDDNVEEVSFSDQTFHMFFLKMSLKTMPSMQLLKW